MTKWGVRRKVAFFIQPPTERPISSKCKKFFPKFSMSNSGLLFVSNITKLKKFFIKPVPYVKKVLYVKVNNYDNCNITHHIVDVYSKISHHYHNVDLRLILKPVDPIKKINTSHPIDVILYDNALSMEIEHLKSSVVSLRSEYTLQGLDLQEIDVAEITSDTIKTYDYVVVGGTFDRLHNGHKILLSQAALRTNKLLTVGVTDVNMIQSKKLWELMEPVEKRIQSVLEFLTDINPAIEYNVLAIQDMYGPTKENPKFQLIVVSEETHRGGDKVNEKRKENGLPLLDKYVVELAQDSHPLRSDEEEAKVSSSNQRMRLLGTLLKPPVVNPAIPKWPYVIGLAGGIASGKSNIADKLNKKGAEILNCDIIAHELYKPGLPLNGTIAEIFGKDVITDNGEIDRKKLGQIVFSNKDELEKLNKVTWPAVIQETQRRIAALGEQGCRVVVMEAAVMVRARWYTHCHQLWSVIIPPAEAIKRLQERNNLTEEEARQRLEAQPSNLEQVAPANVVFSPYWSYKYTQSQVDKAWDELQHYLNHCYK